MKPPTVNAARLALLLLALLFFCTSGFARAEERIKDFDSVINVQPDGSLLVTESMRMQVENNRIRHGPYRDFPTDYEAENGEKMHVDFHVVDVLKDGNKEPYHVSHDDYQGGERVYIGSPDYLVSPGEHTYSLTYEVNRELIFGEDLNRAYDELYWNVTGNQWEFPIDHASATVYLPRPGGDQLSLVKGYTGPSGSKDSDFKYSVDGDGRVHLKTTRVLGPQEGFTFELGFPKGLVKKPTASQNLLWFLRDNTGSLMALISLILTFGLHLWAWTMVGMDPPAGTIVPLFYPPDNLTPAQVRYLMKMDSDNKTFSAAIIDLAVKGAIQIKQNGGFLGFGEKYVLIRHNKGGSLSFLPREELNILSNLMVEDEVVLDDSHATRIQNTVSDFESDLKAAVQEKYFKTNWLWVIPGAVVSGITFLTLAPLVPKYMFYTVMGAEALMIWGFLVLLKAPTAAGRKVMDKIEGFKMYLSTAEKDRMNVLNPPQLTPEVFEKYLPYALALDVENKWTEKFNAALVAAGQVPSSYHGGWYIGSGDFNYSDVCSSIGDSMSSAVSSAMPSSSSGGSGFSGGGGGGGGGGGW